MRMGSDFACAAAAFAASMLSKLRAQGSIRPEPELPCLLVVDTRALPPAWCLVPTEVPKLYFLLSNPSCAVHPQSCEWLDCGRCTSEVPPWTCCVVVACLTAVPIGVSRSQVFVQSSVPHYWVPRGYGFPHPCGFGPGSDLACFSAASWSARGAFLRP
jgi:hypothetical protein